jgi:hypothetical protein
MLFGGNQIDANAMSWLSSRRVSCYTQNYCRLASLEMESKEVVVLTTKDSPSLALEQRIRLTDLFDFLSGGYCSVYAHRTGQSVAFVNLPRSVLAALQDLCVPCSMYKGREQVKKRHFLS